MTRLSTSELVTLQDRVEEIIELPEKEIQDVRDELRKLDSALDSALDHYGCWLSDYTDDLRAAFSRLTEYLEGSQVLAMELRELIDQALEEAEEAAKDKESMDD